MENRTFNYGQQSRNTLTTIIDELFTSGEKAIMNYENKYGKVCSMTISVEPNKYNRPVVVFHNLKYKYQYDFVSYNFRNQVGSNLLSQYRND